MVINQKNLDSVKVMNIIIHRKSQSRETETDRQKPLMSQSYHQDAWSKLAEIAFKYCAYM